MRLFLFISLWCIQEQGEITPSSIENLQYFRFHIPSLSNQKYRTRNMNIYLLSWQVINPIFPWKWFRYHTIYSQEKLNLTDRVINSRFSNYILRTGLFKQISNIDLISCNFLVHFISYFDSIYRILYITLYMPGR